MRHIHSLIVGASLSLCPVIGLASTPATSASAADAPVLLATAVPATAKHAPSATKASADDRSRYAARDEASPKAKNYRGGDTVVIGTTAVVAILAVVLLVVLL
jgi:hypothetical protein